MLFQAHELEQTDRPGVLDEEVDVTVGSCLAARERTAKTRLL